MRLVRLFFLLTICQATHAALSQLSEAQLESRAAYIVTGEVVEVSVEEEYSGRGMVTNRYRVRLKVSAYKKNNHHCEHHDPNANEPTSHEIKTNETIEFSFRQVIHMMRGWSGNTGQSSKVVKGTTIKAYLNAGPNYSLLEPNGFVELH